MKKNDLVRFGQGISSQLPDPFLLRIEELTHQVHTITLYTATLHEAGYVVEIDWVRFRIFVQVDDKSLVFVPSRQRASYVKGSRELDEMQATPIKRLELAVRMWIQIITSDDFDPTA